jgi:hypothetical protein
MAVLSTKTSSGLPAWDKYVKKNPKWRELELAIENGMTAPLLNSAGNSEVKQLKAGDTFVLTSSSTKDVNRVKHAQVRCKNYNGLIPLNRIRKPTSTDVLKEEAIALSSLESRIKEIVSQVGPFEMVIKGDPRKRVFKDIVGARNVTEKVMGREAKSDFNIVSSLGDAIYISHKKAGGAKAFQQYGGVSRQSGTEIQNHPEVQSFLNELTQRIVDNKLVNPCYRYVEDDKLIGMSVFGSNYGKSFGIDNVHVIGQGDPIIRVVPRQENRFELDFSDHLVHNGQVREFQQGDYRTVLAATFRAGRGFDYSGQRYNGARVGIYPYDFIKGRRDIEEV